MINLALLSNIAGACLFLILSCLLLINWQKRLISTALLTASCLSAAWFLISTVDSLDVSVSLALLQFAELVRGAAWIVLTLLVLKFSSEKSRIEKSDKIFFAVFAFFVIAIIVYIFFGRYLDYRLYYQLEKNNTVFIGFLILSLFGLTLLEKLYRNTVESRRWAIRYFCFGLGGIFIYDFYLYSDALLFKRVNVDLAYARGIVNALCVPLIAVATVRNPNWGMELFVSRHVVYRSVVVLGAGIYLVLMSVVGLYIKKIGGNWGGVFQICFFFCALLILFALIFSSNLRTRLKVNLAKHFYKNKYDYREEWINFNKALSTIENTSGNKKELLKILSEVISCDGAGLWLHSEKEQSYKLIDSYGDITKTVNEFDINDELCVFLRHKKWVINVAQYNNQANTYEGLDLPAWITSDSNIWVIFPLYQNDALYGIIMLSNNSANQTFTWEDADLLKTMGYQISNYLALEKVSESLSEAKQFEAFNRLAAFVVHDIKNVIAQLSLITSNAEKYGKDPEFIEDAFATISDATERSKRLLKNLNKVDLNTVMKKSRFAIKQLLASHFDKRPFLDLDLDDIADNIVVEVDADNLISVLEHLIENAFDASEQEAHVSLKLAHLNEQVKIQVIDQGLGMSQEFIEKRLFRPFDTTKGNAGMGIGVYESRELIEAMAGHIAVESEQGQGTVFTILLPALIPANTDARD